MDDYFFSKDHAWICREDGNTVRMGISRFAREELGEIVFIDLPKEGNAVTRDEAVCAFDSLKSSSEVYAPVSGTIKTVNAVLAGKGGLKPLNDDPEGKGWLFTIEMKNPSELNDLMDRPSYEKYVRG